MRSIAIVGWLGIIGALLVWQGLGLVRGPEWPTLSDFFRSFMATEGLSTPLIRPSARASLALRVDSIRFPHVLLRAKGTQTRLGYALWRVQVVDASLVGADYPDTHEAMAMRIDQFTFGSIRIDGVIYEHDVVIARGRVRKRKKKSSKPFRGAFGHTPLSIKENIPWDCRRLVVGTGADGALPVMDEVKQEAARREVDLVIVPTREAIRALQAEPKDTNAILHVTC